MEMPTFVPKVAKQTIGFYKNVFESMFDTLMNLQGQMLKMLDNAPGLPESGKTMIKDMNNTYKTMCVDFKSLVDDNIFKRAEQLFTENEAAAPKPKSKKAAEPAK